MYRLYVRFSHKVIWWLVLAALWEWTDITHTPPRPPIRSQFKLQADVEPTPAPVYREH